jgi:TldD protein
MKTTLSPFLISKKPILKEILNSLNTKYKYVSILASDTIGTSYSVSNTGSNVSDSDFSERGFVIRVFNGINYSEYSFNTIANVESIVNEVSTIVDKDLATLKERNIELMEYPLIKEECITDEYYSEYSIDPFKISTREKIEKMSFIMKKGLEKHKDFIDFRVRYEEVQINKLFLSSKKDLQQAILYTNMTLVCIGKNNHGIKYDFEGFSGLKGLEIFDEADDRIEKVTNSVIDLFNSTRVKPGEYEIICDPSVSGLIAHEAFGHGVEMDMFVKNRAKGKDYIGELLASTKTNMRDGASSEIEVGTYLFDDEGTLGTNTLVLDKGILKSGISDLLSALKLNTQPTGNGRRESFERKAYARMTNTFFEGGNDSLDNMISSIKKGYMLEGYFSGMEDPKNWGIQCVIAKGREIINGKYTGKIISPVTLTGYVPDLLKSISMVSNTPLELSGTGACGKGHKEWVKTSTGGTYIKAIGRLS